MKYFAIEITKATLPLVTELNDGVEPGPESMNCMFMYPATQPDKNHATIITRTEFEATHVIADLTPLYIVHVK